MRAKDEDYIPMIDPEEPPADLPQEEQAPDQKHPDRELLIEEILAGTGHGAEEQRSPVPPLFPDTAPEAAELLNDHGEAPGAAAVMEPEQRMHILLRIFLVLLALAVVGFAGFCIWWEVRGGASERGFYPAGEIVQVQLIQEQKPQLDETLIGADGRYTVEGIAETVMPSIVEIYTYKEQRMTGSGTGIILTEDGYIATNAHVISGAESISVRLYGDSDQRYTAEVIGHDTKTDLAVLRIPAGALPPARLGDSEQVKLGEAVCALGNPAGLNSSISTGIISGMHRKVRSESTHFQMECFQTDAAISPGNSGGALVNMFGQVIGITSSKYSTSIISGTSYEGLGFAITINEALPILKELMEKGYVSGRVRIGIRFLEHKKALQYAEGELPEIVQNLGIQVMGLDEDSDINKTELQPGDWILRMNGQPITDYDSISAALGEAAAGDRVHCECCRVTEDGSVYTFEIEFALLEDHSGNY